MNQEWPTQNAETPKTTPVEKVEVIEKDENKLTCKALNKHIV